MIYHLGVENMFFLADKRKVEEELGVLKEENNIK